MTLLYTEHLYHRMITRDIGWPTIEAVARSGEVVDSTSEGWRKLELCGFVVVMDRNTLVTVYHDSKQASRCRWSGSARPPMKADRFWPSDC